MNVVTVTAISMPGVLERAGERLSRYRLRTMLGYQGTPIAIRGGTRKVECGVDAHGHWISIATAGAAAEVLRCPGWRGGVGGMALIASPDDRYVALFIYSGQSTQGYEVFSVEPVLAHLGGLAEGRGHGDAPSFSASSHWLATLISSEPRVRGTGEYFETVQDPSAQERVIVDWARLHVQRLPDAMLHTVDVGVEIPLSTEIDCVLDWNAYDAVRFVGDELRLHMPWGEDVVVALPATAPLTCRNFVGSIQRQAGRSGSTSS